MNPEKNLLFQETKKLNWRCSNEKRCRILDGGQRGATSFMKERYSDLLNVLAPGFDEQDKRIGSGNLSIHTLLSPFTLNDIKT